MQCNKKLSFFSCHSNIRHNVLCSVNYAEQTVFCVVQSFPFISLILLKCKNIDIYVFKSRSYVDKEIGERTNILFLNVYSLNQNTHNSFVSTYLKILMASHCRLHYKIIILHKVI